MGTALSFLLPCLLLPAACAVAPESAMSPPSLIPKASKALERARGFAARSEYASVLSELSHLSEEGLEARQRAEILYLRGLSLFRQVSAELGEDGREPSASSFTILTADQRERLWAAHDQCLSSSDLAPSAPFASEAAYLAARTQDYGYLQNFPRAMELYRWCLSAFPETPAASRCRARYEDLRSKSGEER